MKKFLSLLLVFVMMVSLVACGGKEDPVKERDLPEGNYVEIGDGITYVSTPGGTSENGNIPIIYIGNESMMSIGLNAWGFNGSALSFVYIDGMLVAQEQLADSQTSIMLEKAQLAEGVHTVEVVQYENDEPGTEMITYKSMQYQVKAK